MNKLFVTMLLIMLIALTSCSSTVNLRHAKVAIANEKYEEAIMFYDSKASKILSAQGDIVYNLDKGMLSHYNANYTDSITSLADAELGIEENYTESIVGNVSTYLVNDNTAEYQGEDFENIYINIFNALNYYHLGKLEDSIVELNRLNEKLSQLQLKYNQVLSEYDGNSDYRHFEEEYFTSSALSHYLGYLLYTSIGNQNAANVSAKLFKASYDSLRSYYVDNHSDLIDEVDTSNLNIIAFTGIVPEKINIEESFRFGDSYYSIAYPEIPNIRESVDRIAIAVNGKEYFLTNIEDISHIARMTFLPKQTIAINKSIGRATSRAIVSAVADTSSSVSDDETVQAILTLISTISDLFGMFAESADVRGAHFLPSNAWVGSIDLEEGVYDVSVGFLQGNKLLSVKDYDDFEVKENNINLLETFCFVNY